MPAPSQLNLIGNPELFAPTGEPLTLKTRKHLALLMVLAVERRRTYSCDWLTELLWEGLPAKKARHSLSTALWDLRRAFGDDVVEESNGAEIHFRRDGVRVDLDHLCPGGPDVEIDVVFGDFSLRDAGNLERWMDGVKADYMPKLLHRALLQLTEARRARDLHRTVDLAGRILRVSEFSEDGILARVEALAALGDRWAALDAFEAWSQRMREELGRDPSVALTAEVSAILLQSRTHRTLLPELMA